MRFTIVVLSCCAAAAGLAVGEEVTPGRTGAFNATFTQRSPASDLKQLAVRLSQKTLSGDYDLAKEGFIVHVPETYDPAKPAGLIVMINYKDAAEPPSQILPILKERNVIFTVLQGSQQPAHVKCGLALDAVHNLTTLYKVDPARVYVFGFDQDSAGQRLGIGCPDVFSGFLVTNFFDTWKPMRAANCGTYKPKAPPPPARYLPAARTHPAVFCTTDGAQEYGNLVLKAFTAEGFRQVKKIVFTPEDYHYPNYTTAWFSEALAFLDANAAERAAKPAATRPATTRPAMPVPTLPK